ncbi:hypothetical protein [Streptomyces sp. MBT33]|uniref:hypothetical protein n=1 Tax=Streptomyces sp. MBT33 TaxID=1488363 RepID=UPI00190CEC14|nr:hypothetical protein [Streptomyces sp. MBT33]MBK3643699.1 hypothetical protein [Streptomyces sp. MBT33]
MTLRPVPATAPAIQSGDVVAPPANEPIYAALAARWATAGRVVPGQADQEWNMLMSRRPWPTR